MSDWTRTLTRGAAAALKPALLLGAVAALSGCLEAPQQGGSQVGFLSSSETRPREVLQEAGMASGVVKVSPPVGYCIDARSLRATRNGGFALLASCRVLSAGQQGQSVAPVIMTVSVLPRSAGAEMPTTADLAASFAPAKPLWTGETTGVHVVQLAAGGDQMVPNADPRHWRAMMLMNDHLVGLALYGPVDSDVVISGGRDLLIDLAAGIRNASPTPETIARHTDTPEEAAEIESSETRAAISDALPDTIPDAEAAPGVGQAASVSAGDQAKRRGRT